MTGTSMEVTTSGSSSGVKKQEDSPDDSKGGEKRDVKPVVKTLNRVPRACNACRKQKMRCEGADNPPCRRCRHTGLECLFEKPSREATLTGEAGLERIRNLENHVSEIRASQGVIQSGITEIMAHLRGGSSLFPRSPSTFHPPFSQQSPNMQAISPITSTPTASSASTHLNDVHRPASGGSVPSAYAANGIPPQRQGRPQLPSAQYRGPPLITNNHGHSGSNDFQSVSPTYTSYTPTPQTFSASSSQGPILPPFSSIENMAPPGPQQVNMSAVRYATTDSGQLPRPSSKHHNISSVPGSKRHAPGSSNVTSADSSDSGEDEDGELPASGLVAPWEVLRGLADVALQRAGKEGGDNSEPQSRARTPSPDRQSRPTKRRKTLHKSMVYPDVVSKNVITDLEARDLFRIFYHGCSTFLPVFDSNTDTYDSLHERFPFAVDCICMVAARVRDGGGNPSDTYLKCLDQVQSISCGTLFSPVTRNEVVQSMILVAGWSDNGWLSGGHAVRMAMELSMHKAWPKLLKRMKDGKALPSPEDRELVIQSRIWFCLYLFEHQLSYGTGRPAILKDDESISRCRYLLQHPLAIEDDMRLVSTVELMAIRERVNNKLAPFDRPVEDETFLILRDADMEFRNWYATWDQAFSQKYEDAAFYRQSLQIQHLHAELFHNATALRGIDGPDDVLNIHPAQRELAIRSIQIARQGLDVTLNSAAYREGMKYAVHYTHAAATFAASFLLRLSRLFPEETDTQAIRKEVELLASLMSEIPGKRYALTLQVMLKRSKKRKASSVTRSSKPTRDSQPMAVAMHSSAIPANAHDTHGGAVEPFSPTSYDPTFPNVDPSMHPSHMTIPTMTSPPVMDAEYIWRGFEMTANAHLPVWLSDESLGGNSFSQNGMDAFLLPNSYLPPARIW